MGRIFLAKAFAHLDLPVLTARFQKTGFTLVDIGGRNTVVRELRLVSPFAHYVTFEPDRTEAGRLAETHDGEWQKFTVVPAAIAGRAGDAELYVTQKPGMSSLLEPDMAVVDRFARAQRFQTIRTETVPTLPLDAAASTHGFADACFLKIDTQGTELEILRSGEELIRTVLGIKIEVSFYPLYRGQALFADVDAFLRQRGFELFLLNRINLRHANARPDLFSRRVTVYGHALYFRKPTPQDAAARTRLLGLLLAFGYFDLARAIAEPDEIAEVERVAALATRQALEDADATLLEPTSRDQTREP